MQQYETTRPHDEPTDGPRWLNASAISAIAGGVLLTIVGFALFSVLEETAFGIIEPLGAIAVLLMALGLPALYASEREWFTRLATGGFGLLAGGWIVATIALIGTTVTMPPISETFFLVFLLSVLAAIVGAIAFGVAILRTPGATAPRLSGWLLVLALPVGVAATAAFTTYVMGEFADPWAGPFVFLGVAWIVLGRHARRTLAGRSRRPMTEAAER